MVPELNLLDINKRQEQLLKECEEWTQVFIKGLRDDEVFYDASFYMREESQKLKEFELGAWNYEVIKERCGDRLGVYRNLLPFHAHQIYVGNCWLIAALMALSQNPSAIKRIIPEGSYSLKHGIFLIRLFKEGEPHIVVVDGHFPVLFLLEDQLPFILRGDMWAGLIEKAVAKEYGGYQKLKGGNDRIAFRMFTGAPSVIYFMDEVKNVNILWEKLIEFRSQNFPMTVTAKAKLVNPEIYEDEGTHAYAILDVCIRDGNRVILIGNASAPRKGKYETIPKLTKKELDTIDDSDIRKEIEESLFWIDVQELIDFFVKLTVCRYRHGWYEKKTPKLSSKDTEGYLRFRVGKRCQVTIERTQTGEKYEGFINIHKAARNGDVGEMVKSFQALQISPFGQIRSVETDPFDLEPGIYIVVYLSALFTSSTTLCYDDDYWVFRSPTPLDHLAVWIDSQRSGKRILCAVVCEKSLMEMMKGRVGKEVQKGVFLREYSMGNVVVVMAENKTEKKIAMDIVAKSDEPIISMSIRYVSEQSDRDFHPSFLFQIPAQSSKILGCIIRYHPYYLGGKPNLKCLYKIRIHKSAEKNKKKKKEQENEKCDVVYEYYDSTGARVRKECQEDTNPNENNDELLKSILSNKML